jgi:hypothetical protein
LAAEILRLLHAGPRPVGEIAAEVDVSQQFAPVAAFVEAFWTPRLAALKDEIEKKR